jgi:hypothetical protein
MYMRGARKREVASAPWLSMGAVQLLEAVADVASGGGRELPRKLVDREEFHAAS